MILFNAQLSYKYYLYLRMIDFNVALSLNVDIWPICQCQFWQCFFLIIEWKESIHFKFPALVRCFRIFFTSNNFLFYLILDTCINDFQESSDLWPKQKITIFKWLEHIYHLNDKFNDKTDQTRWIDFGLKIFRNIGTNIS